MNKIKLEKDNTTTIFFVNDDEFETLYNDLFEGNKDQNIIKNLRYEVEMLKDIIQHDNKEIQELKDTIWDLRQEFYEG